MPYRSLVNLTAELIVNGRYEEAQRVSRDIDKLVDTYAPGVFPRLDYAQTNALLADLRGGTADVSQALRRQREIVSRYKVDGDPFYVENALAVYLTLAGESDEALEIYEKLLVELANRRDPETSMLYLLGANRCATRFVANDRDGVVDEWSQLHEVVQTIPYTIGPILVRRHQLLAAVIQSEAEMSASAFDTVLIGGRLTEFGPLWDQLGRGFRMPEIEWWR